MTYQLVLVAHLPAVHGFIEINTVDDATRLPELRQLRAVGAPRECSPAGVSWLLELRDRETGSMITQSAITEEMARNLANEPETVEARIAAAVEQVTELNDLAVDPRWLAAESEPPPSTTG